MKPFTLDLRVLIQRLLKDVQALAAWTLHCDIYIDKFEGETSTSLVIECHFMAVAELFCANCQFFDLLAAGIPIPVVIKLGIKIIAVYQSQELQLTHPGVKEFAMIATESNQQQSVPQSAKNQAINLLQIPEPMRGMLRLSIAELELPVYLRPDGDYNLPLTSFDVAWGQIGEAIKRGEQLLSIKTLKDESGTPVSISKKATSKKSDSESSSILTVRRAKAETAARPVYMREKLTAEDVALGKNGIDKTIANFFLKVNMAHLTKGQIIDAIANRTDYGQQLLKKLHDAYGKRDVIYRVKPEEWTKIEEKIVLTVKSMALSNADEQGTKPVAHNNVGESERSLEQADKDISDRD